MPYDTAVACVEEADRALLLAHVLGKDRAWLVAHGNEIVLAPEEQRTYDAFLARRMRGEPLAYIVGEAWFYGRRFEVTNDVLVPRPETEHLVDAALAFLRAFVENDRGCPIVLDVGTGSGAIACTIAAEVPQAIVYATERSQAALRIALRNAKNLVAPSTAFASRTTLGITERRTALGVSAEFADLLPADAALRFDCVVANLPYIPSADVPSKPDPVGFEPREATDGGPDGLHEYRRLLEALPPRISAGGLVLLETAPPTARALAELAMKAFPNARATISRDYAGRERLVAIEVPSL
ncbi:MAG: peptide chain release factor N(5)-glutamine methyltransferase [Candidatus Tyrphobacter sp.]